MMAARTGTTSERRRRRQPRGAPGGGRTDQTAFLPSSPFHSPHAARRDDMAEFLAELSGAALEVPDEWEAFMRAFNKVSSSWQLSCETEPVNVGEGHYLIPDFILANESTGEAKYIELFHL